MLIEIDVSRYRASYYRLQRSSGKVMFLQLSVSHSVHRWGVFQTPPRQTPPLGRHPPADTPTTPMATAANGTHPTGMLSCFAKDPSKLSLV